MSSVTAIDASPRLDSKIPDGPLGDKWENYKFTSKLVNPANKRKYQIIVVGTGLFAAWLHLGSVPMLWQSSYGKTLLLKLAVLFILFATGAYNWLRVKPILGEELAEGRLRRSAAIELAAGAVVLAVTAALVATPTPGRSSDVEGAGFEIGSAASAYRAPDFSGH